MLWVMFIAYSLISTQAFDAFTCYKFGGDAGVLRADVSIKCNSADHDSIKVIAWLAIVIWPILATLVA